MTRLDPQATRRQLLAGAALLSLPTAWAQVPSTRPGFDTKTVAEALRGLGLGTPQRSTELQLGAPDLAENGGQVPLTLSWTAAGVRRLWVLSDKNPSSLIAQLEPSDALLPRIELRVKLAHSGTVTLLAQTADGRLLQTQAEVRVTLGGCGDTPDDTPPPAQPQPSLIRARRTPQGGAQLRMLVKHEMESGQRTDSKGRLVPAWYVRELALTHQGQPVFKALLGTGVAKDPLWGLGLRAAQVGDSLALSWADNRGARRSDTATVQAAA